MDEILEIKNSAPEADRRAYGRLDARIGEGASVFLTAPDQNTAVEFRVIDFSSGGLGLETVPGQPNWIPAVGETIDADFRVNRRQADGLHLTCRVVQHGHGVVSGRRRLGLAIQPDAGLEARVTRTKSATTALPTNFFLAGMIDHPLYYDQTSTVHVLRLSRGEFLLRNHDPAFAVFQSMPVIFSLNLFSGSEPIHGHVSWVRGTPYGIDFAVKVDLMTDETDRGLVRYIMRFLDWPPFRLRRLGFDTGSIKKVVTFRFVKTQQEYISVLELRRNAYAAARKLKRDSDLGAVSHSYDEHSRILTAWHHGTLVGSVAILFGDGEQVRFEAQKHIEDTDFFRLFPKRGSLIEVSGLCLHHDYRKSDVLNGLFERIFQVLITTRRENIIASCDRFLWPLYESIGFEKTGLQYTLTGSRQERTMDLIVINRRVPAYGWGQLDPLRWDEVYRGMADYLDRAGLMKKSPRHMLVSPVYAAYVDVLKRVHEVQNRSEESVKALRPGLKLLRFLWESVRASDVASAEQPSGAPAGKDRNHPQQSAVAEE